MSDANDQKMTSIGELRHLKGLVDEVTVSLRSQRDILKTRGMNLPPMAMQTLSSIQTDLDSLDKLLFDDQTELGQLRALADTSAMINSSLDADQVLTQAMDVVISLTGAQRGYIILKDPKTGEYEFRVTSENELMPRQGGDSGAPKISTTILTDVIQSGEPLLADNAYKDESFQNNVSIVNMALRSVLCVPLKYKGDVIGVVYVDNRLRDGVFGEREKTLLTAFANQTAIAIENAQLFASIQRALIEISQMKELIDNVFASIGSGVIATDSRHTVTRFNDAAAKILERAEDAFIGHKLASVLPSISANLDTYVANVREKDEVQTIEAEMETGSRGRVALTIKLSPLKDAQRNTQGVALVLDDLTEQREREEVLGLVKRYLPPQLVDNIETIAQLALGGERREVSCVFIDVRPASTFDPGLRPQQVMEMLNVYLARATDMIHATDGIIDKYMGNEVMALWNTQLNPKEDHSLHAVEACLNLRAAFIELYKKLGMDPNPHFYRMGLHSGVATLGNVGSLNRREFSAIGDSINLSHRLLENTGPGQIIISEETKVLLEKSLPRASYPITIESRGSINVKGREQAVSIYEVFKS
jgi:PAS domain S-box-containing protein